MLWLRALCFLFLWLLQIHNTQDQGLEKRVGEGGEEEVEKTKQNKHGGIITPWSEGGEARGKATEEERNKKRKYMTKPKQR